jgi:hypothetical protein
MYKKRINIQTAILKIRVMLTVIILTGLFSCSKKELSEETSPNNGTKYKEIGFETHQKNLNIIYFVPKDNPEVPDYKNRLSRLLIYFQEYIKEEMDRNGFGKKTFGLSVDSSDANSPKVNIITIHGKLGEKDYDYESATTILNEINSYKEQHPKEFSSEYHNLIILPERSDKGRQPFFGWGKSCFALDNPNIRVEEIKTTTSNYIGGMLHELGHGLNLPHNKAKVSEQKTLGTSLMGAGNNTFGRKPTFITEQSAAILNRNEVFQSESKMEFYELIESSLDIRLGYNSDSKVIQIDGNFQTDKKVVSILYLLDPNVENEGTGGNHDYNAIGWQKPAPSDNNLKMDIPTNELEHTEDIPYELRVTLVFENGTLNTDTFLFHFKDGKPDFTSHENPKFYQNCGFGGYEIELGIGEYSTQKMKDAGITNNDVSGIKIPLGFKVTLYDGDNFSGNSKVLTSSKDCITGFNDKTSSIKIELK